MERPRLKGFFLIILLGIGVIWAARAFKSQPETQKKSHEGKLVAVQTLTKQNIAPTITAFGRITPSVTWQGIVEVGGKVVYRHPLLEKGHFLPKDTLLLTLDRTEYQLKLEQAKASLSVLTAQKKQIRLDVINQEKNLDIEKKNRVIVDKAWQRALKLRQKGMISPSTLDLERKAHLASLKSEQAVRHQLALLMPQQQILEAQIARETSALQQAQLSLDKTELILPFYGQVSMVDVALNEWVKPQQKVLEVINTKKMEITVHIPLLDWQRLQPALDPIKTDRLLQVGSELSAWVYVGERNKKKIAAKVQRVADSIDVKTQTIGVVVEVNGKKAHQSLIRNGALLQVQLVGKPQSHWVVPQASIHQNNLYLFSPNNTLTMVPIEVLFNVNGSAVVQGSFPNSPKLITTDLLPAIDGMLVSEFIEKQKESTL